MACIDVRNLPSVKKIREANRIRRQKENDLGIVISKESKDFELEHPDFENEILPLPLDVIETQPTTNEKQEEHQQEPEENVIREPTRLTRECSIREEGTIAKKKTTKRKKTSEDVESSEKKTRRKVLSEREGEICIEEEKPIGESEHSEQSDQDCLQSS